METKIPLKYLFLTAGLLGFPASIGLALNPSDPNHVALDYLSPAGWGLLVMMLVLSGAFTLVFFWMHQNASLSQRLTFYVMDNRRILRILLSVIFFVTYTLCLIPSKYFNRYVFLHQKALPILVWVCLVTFLVLLWLIRFGTKPYVIREATKHIAKYKVHVLLTGLVLLVIISIIVFGGLGMTVDRNGWYQAGVPILTWQVQVSLLLALTVTMLGANYHRARQSQVVDIGLFFAIWVTAAFVWTHVELKPNFFFEFNERYHTYYPYSDARSYSLQAQSLLAGEGIRPEEDKPLYYLFLATIQCFTGADYLKTVAVQSSILALSPALLFWLGKTLYRREAGVLIAGMYIAREANAILFGQDLNLTHTRLLLTENPTALILILTSLLLIFWFKKPEKKGAFILVCGGVVGLGALVRLNTYIVFPAVIGLSALVYFTSGIGKRWFKHVLIFSLGVGVVIAPWNYLTYTKIGIPYSVKKYINSLYMRDFLDEPESVGKVAAIASPLPDSHARIFAHTARKELPSLISIGFIVSNHLIHNEIMSLFILPTTFHFASLDEYSDHPVWSPKVEWEGDLRPSEWLLLGLNLALVVLGVAAAYKRWGWTGLVPAGIHLAYHLSNGLARKSGGRYLVPVDWVLVLYYGLAVAVLIHFLLKALFGIRSAPDQNNSQGSSHKSGIKRTILLPFVAVSAVVLAGISLPAANALIKSDYKTYTAQDLLPIIEHNLSFSKWFPTTSSFVDFLEPEKHVAFSGKTMYSNVTSDMKYSPDGEKVKQMSYSAFTFHFVSPDLSWVEFPVESARAFKLIANETEMIVVGCQKIKYRSSIQALALILLEDSYPVAILTPPEDFETRCDLTP